MSRLAVIITEHLSITRQPTPIKSGAAKAWIQSTHKTPKKARARNKGIISRSRGAYPPKKKTIAFRQNSNSQQAPLRRSRGRAKQDGLSPYLLRSRTRNTNGKARRSRAKANRAEEKERWRRLPQNNARTQGPPRARVFVDLCGQPDEVGREEAGGGQWGRAVFCGESRAEGEDGRNWAKMLGKKGRFLHLTAIEIIHHQSDRRLLFNSPS
jgi:hypothetical protein